MGVVAAGVDADLAVQVGGVDVADDGLGEEEAEVLLAEEEGAVGGGFLVGELGAQVGGPFLGGEGPVAFPVDAALWVSQFY